MCLPRMSARAYDIIYRYIEIIVRVFISGLFAHSFCKCPFISIGLLVHLSRNSCVSKALSFVVVVVRRCPSLSTHSNISSEAAAD